mgnify:CR=1 FL=1
MSHTERTANLLVDMIVHLENELTKYGLPKQKAETMARDICDQLRLTFGGEQFYFPKGKELDVILKHHEIYKRFTGSNQIALSKEFGMTVPHIYRVLKSIHKEELDKRQPDLF